MPTWALGYASKTGLRAMSDAGEKVTIPSIPIGNMFWPSPEKMDEFITSLNGNDTLVSPSGPNASYLAGAFRQGAIVHWINPARLADIIGKHARLAPQQLLKIWQEREREGGTEFYVYMESDYQIAELAVTYTDWLNTEAEKVALSNSLDQSLRKQMEIFRFLKPPKEQWVNGRVASAFGRFRAVARKGGVTLPSEIAGQYRAHLELELGRLYDLCLTGDKKQTEAVQQRLKEMEMASVLEILEEREKTVQNLLNRLPHSRFFEGYKGIGPKSASGTLVFVSNPLLYPTFPHLNSLLGMRVVDGQAIRRYDPEEPRDLRYNHRGHQVMCFDFGDKAHFHEGFFQDLYRAYKCHQFLVYWPLVELTREVFSFWRGAEAERETDEFDATENEEAGMSAVENLGEEGSEQFETNGEPSPENIREWLSRLQALSSDLPIIVRSKGVRRMIDELASRPAWPGVKKLFSRATGGGNLQMTLQRLDTQAKRHNGITLARIAYYEWLSLLNEPLPLEPDFVYARQCKYVLNHPPQVYSPQVTLDYYTMRAQEMQANGKTLPEEGGWLAQDPQTKEWTKERFPGLRL